jgi:hypothetical protein
MPECTGPRYFFTDPSRAAEKPFFGNQIERHETIDPKVLICFLYVPAACIVFQINKNKSNGCCFIFFRSMAGSSFFVFTINNTKQQSSMHKESDPIDIYPSWLRFGGGGQRNGGHWSRGREGI